MTDNKKSSSPVFVQAIDGANKHAVGDAINAVMETFTDHAKTSEVTNADLILVGLFILTRGLVDQPQDVIDQVIKELGAVVQAGVNGHQTLDALAAA